MDRNYPIRVLQVGMSPYYGGTESFIMNQYRKINRDQVQFDFLNVYSGEIACQKEIQKLGGRIFKIDMARHHGMKKYYSNIKDFFEKNAKEFQIIHCNFQSLINTDMLSYAKKYHIPIRIAHAHNAGYGQKPNLMQRFLITKNKLLLFNVATHYFACSSLAGKWMFHREATIINNAIDVDRFRYSSEKRKEMRKNLKIENRKVFVFVGRLDHQKNPIFLLEIFKCILDYWKDSYLLIVGDGILKNEILDKVMELKIENYVRLLGSRDDVSDILQAADIFLLPSRFEGLGIVFIEAQAAGVKVYTSEKTVPAEVKITDLVEFISLDKTPDEWAKIIVKNGIAEHKDTKAEICKAGYDNFINSKKLESIYLNMVSTTENVKLFTK